MISFLRFVVEHSLTNQKQLINERAIGQSVFKKPVDWDPTVDTIVRSEIRRLRTKLDQYYEGLGRHDQLRIHIPKGTYVPAFVPQETQIPLAENSISVTHTKPTSESEGTPDASRRRLFFFSLMAVACLIFIAVHFGRELAGRGNSHNEFSTLPFTTDFGKEYSPAISPDGKTVAYVGDEDNGSPDIFLRNTDQKTSRRLNPSPDVRLYPSWSHDGKRIAFLAVRGDRLAVIVHSLRDGTETTVTSIEKSVGQWTGDSSPLLGCPGPIWSADDHSLILEDHLAHAATGGLIQVGLDGVQQAQITATTGELHDLYPRLSPDGRTVAFVQYSSHGVGEIFVQSLNEPGSARQLTQDHRTIQGLAWGNNGTELIFSSNRKGNFQLWSIRMADGVISPLPTDSSWASEPSTASQGDWLIYVQASHNWNIWRRPLAGGGSDERFIASSGRNYDARYSPDGGHVAFASDRSGYMELWVADTNGHDSVQLTHLSANWLGGINWSPDGKFIAFDARPAGHSAIYIVPAAGGAPKPLDDQAYEERMPAWSTDGRSIYFNSNRDGTTAIFARSLTNGFTRLISPPGMFSVAASGNELIIASNLGELFHSDLDGSHFEALPGHVKAEPVMSWVVAHDGLVLSQYDSVTKSYNLARYHASRLIPSGQLGGVLVPNAPDIAISNDERWVLYSKQENAQSDLTIRKNNN